MICLILFYCCIAQRLTQSILAVFKRFLKEFFYWNLLLHKYFWCRFPERIVCIHVVMVNWTFVDIMIDLWLIDCSAGHQAGFFFFRKLAFLCTCGDLIMSCLCVDENCLVCPNPAWLQGKNDSCVKVRCGLWSARVEMLLCGCLFYHPSCMLGVLKDCVKDQTLPFQVDLMNIYVSFFYLIPYKDYFKVCSYWKATGILCWCWNSTCPL